ncbi:hypothetical protein [Paenibacillus sp. 1P07SE]|uniref:hypothetical protein n=1 Tax=Paenibacillus sp. 1P07SE TaxID=3132209 RepID=UPI0039A70213
MTLSRLLKFFAGLAELFLAIPVLGGALIIASNYTLLGIMLIVHLVTYVLSRSNHEPAYGPAIGIVTSLLAWIPFVGWFLHLMSGLFLLVNATQRGSGPIQRT